MAAESTPNFKKRVANRLAEMAYSWARPAVYAASPTLARAMRFANALQLQTAGEEHAAGAQAALYIPHYWAVYLHDGRGAFGPRGTRPDGKPITHLVWFRNSWLDPRLIEGEQVERLADVKHLTEKQFYDYLDKRAFARRFEGEGSMTVAGYWPHPTAGKKFFDNNVGMAGFIPEAKTIIKEEFSKHVKDILADVLNIEGSVTVTI